MMLVTIESVASRVQFLARNFWNIDGRYYYRDRGNIVHRIWATGHITIEAAE